MTVLYTPTGTQDNIQGEFEQVLYWTIHSSLARMIGLQLLGLLVFGVFGIAFTYLADTLGGLPIKLEIDARDIPIALAGGVVTIILHELVHGGTMRRFGAEAQYGVMWRQFMFYATSPGYAFRRNAYLLVAVAPLVVITLLAIGGMILLRGTDWVALLVACAVINGSGASGDLWITSVALRYPPEAYIVDERNGVRVLLRRDEKPR